MMKNAFKTTPDWDKILIGSAYFYLVIPILIFFFGWLKLPLAILSAAILLAGTYFTLRDFGYIKDYGFISLEFLVFSFLILFTWVVFSGIGGFGHQNWDFLTRNAILRDLINYHWPVIYDYTGDSTMGDIFGNSGGLVYYLSYWLPSALVGKLLGWKMANFTLFGWSLAGVYLCILLMTRYIGKARILVVLAFVFFSGLDIIGTLYIEWDKILLSPAIDGVFSTQKMLGRLFALILDNSHLEMWTTSRTYINNFSFLNYNSYTTQLGHVFNQCIPAWLVTLLFLNLTNKRILFFTCILMVYYAPLPAVGLVPFILYKFLDQNRDILNQKQRPFPRFKSLIKENASFQNTIVPLIIGFIILGYYASMTGNQRYGFIWNLYTINPEFIRTYIIFCTLEFLLFGMFTFNNKENRTILIISLVWLTIIPFFIFGIYNDFGLRVSIPPLIILFTVGFKNILNKYEGQLHIRQQFTKVLLIMMLLVASITPLHEIFRSRDEIVKQNGFPLPTDAVITYGSSEAESQFGFNYKKYYCRNFVTGNPEDKWFFRVLARK